MLLNNENLFITVEGIDNSGTTTITEMISENYDNIIQCQEPTNTRFGEMTRDVIDSESDTVALTDFFFFMGDRIHNNKETIKPALQDDQSVICDRYVDSTYAYQPLAISDMFDCENDVFEYVKQINEPVIIEPDITLLLDIDVKTAQSRCESKKKDKYEESYEFQKRVRGRYNKICSKNERIHLIDANKPIENVFHDCISVIETFIKESD